MRRGPTYPLSPCASPSPLAGEGRGEGVLVRDVLTLSFRLVPSCHSRRFQRCHSGLFLLVIPDVSPPVIPDVINRESKGRGEGVPEGAVEARTYCEPSPRSRKKKILDSR